MPLILSVPLHVIHFKSLKKTQLIFFFLIGDSEKLFKILLMISQILGGLFFLNICKFRSCLHIKWLCKVNFLEANTPFSKQHCFATVVSSDKYFWSTDIQDGVRWLLRIPWRRIVTSFIINSASLAIAHDKGVRYKYVSLPRKALV